MENGDLADSIKDSALYAEYSWSLKEGLNTNPLTWKTVETQQKRMTILEQYNSNEIAASYDQIKNIPKEVLNNKNILYSSKNIDDNSKISCFTFNGGNAGDITNLEKDYSEEESDDNTDEEDEIDDEDSCESCDDDTRSSKTSNNLFSYDYNELQHKDKHVDSSELYSETTDNKTEKNVVDCTDRLDMRFIEKKKERKNKQGIDWKPKKERSTNWLTEQMYSGTNARKLLTKILPYSRPTIISPHCSDSLIWKIIANACSEPPRRRRLSSVNTFNDVIKLIEKSSNIIVLTGAGVSVSCGIPDFRSSDGIYSRLAKDFPDLPDPQAMFDINYFSRDPRPFYRFAREIYPGQFKPSPCHRFIKLLEDKNKLLRNYTQNIDTLEQAAGIKNVIECHGSFSTASCTKCKYKCSAENIRTAIFEQRIPVCPQCQSNVEQSVKTSQILSEEGLSNLVKNGIMKPDIVFFGEGLSDEFHTVMANDKNECDLLIVIGSSLKVRPVALIPSSIPAHVPQILINREKLHHLDFDVKLLGDGDIIINQICQHLGGDFKDICFSDDVLRETTNLVPNLAMDGIGEEVCENADKEKGLRTNYIKCKHLADTHYIQSPLSLRRNILPSTSKINNDNSVNQSPEELKSSNCNHCSANRDNKLQQQWQQNKKISERLIDGTYYWHEQSASCVFPGAQVTTCSDTETDDDELFGEIPSLSMVEETATTCTSRQQYGMDIASLSPIMTPSVEAEMVNDIESSKTVSQTAVNDKNDVNDSTYQFNLQSSTSPNSSNPTIIMDNAIINAQVSNLNIINNITTKNRIPILTSISAMEEFHNPPPYKKPRDSWEATDAADIDETKLNVTNYVTQLPPSSNANVNLL